MWKQWINAILGLVVLAAPFLSLSAGVLAWTMALSGIAIAVLAVWTLAEGSMSTQSDSSFARR